MATRRRSERDGSDPFAGLGKPRQRTPREAVVEILAEGLWSLICEGRGPRHDSHPAEPHAGSPQDPASLDRRSNG